MELGKVVGTIVSTKKDERLVGSKLLLVRPRGAQGPEKDLVAVDMVGAGVGELVLVVTGGGARQGTTGPIDAAIVGIVDQESSKLP